MVDEFTKIVSNTLKQTFYWPSSGIPCMYKECFLKSFNIYIYIYIFGPVKPELGVIPSGQEVIQAWIFKIFLVKSSMYQ